MSEEVEEEAEETEYEEVEDGRVMLTGLSVDEESGIGFKRNEAEPLRQHFILYYGRVVIYVHFLYSHCWHLSKSDMNSCNSDAATPVQANETVLIEK